MKTPSATLLSLLLLALTPLPALAYVGPGAGLGLIGSLIAVIAALLVGIVGLIVFPVRLLMKRRQEETTTKSDRKDDDEADAVPDSEP